MSGFRLRSGIQMEMITAVLYNNPLGHVLMLGKKGGLLILVVQF